MPFIRYAIGDRGKLTSGCQCSCGNKNPIIKLSSGRVGQYIYLADGKKANFYVFLYTIETINEHIGSLIKQFKIVQNNIYNFTAYFVIRESFNSWKVSVCKFFSDSIKEESLKNAKWDFEFINNIS